MTIPIYISARSSDPLENLVIHAMKETFLDYDGDEIVGDHGEEHWKEGGFPTQFGATFYA